jgi:hypothetical protein
MANPQSVTDKIDAIKHSCTPLGVTVRFIKRKHRYYVKLSCDIQKSVEWVQQWGGFYEFSKYQIRPHFPQAEITSTTVGAATYFIGTFFDFITHG